MRLILGQGIPNILAIYVTHQEAVELILTSLAMTQCRDEIQNYHLTDDERMRYVLSQGF